MRRLGCGRGEWWSCFEEILESSERSPSLQSGYFRSEKSLVLRFFGGCRGLLGYIRHNQNGCLSVLLAKELDLPD